MRTLPTLFSLSAFVKGMEVARWTLQPTFAFRCIVGMPLAELRHGGGSGAVGADPGGDPL